MADHGHDWGPPPHSPAHGRLPQQASLWEPPPLQASLGKPPSVQSPWPPKPPWYRQAWFVGMVIVVVFGAIGAFLGSRVA
jgi:hypothetical protein